MSAGAKRYQAKLRRFVENLEWLERKETTRCGVYMLMLNGVTQYIGKSVDVDARISCHRKERKFQFDTVRFAAVPVEMLDVVERTLLHWYEPPKNTLFPSVDKCVVVVLPWVQARAKDTMS